MKKDNKVSLLKSDIESLRMENKQCKDMIALQRKRLDDLESLCLWSARRVQPINRHYILDSLEKNKRL